MASIRAATSTAGWAGHDCRRTWTTIMQRLGVPRELRKTLPGARSRWWRRQPLRTVWFPCRRAAGDVALSWTPPGHRCWQAAEAGALSATNVALVTPWASQPL